MKINKILGFRISGKLIIINGIIKFECNDKLKNI